MNWKGLFKTVAHAAIGGAATGVAAVKAGASFKVVGWAALAGAATSVFSLFSESPLFRKIPLQSSSPFGR